MACGQQPLRSRFDLTSSRSAVRWGRKHTAEVLKDWRVGDAVTEDALLIASELLSNAVQHATKPLRPPGGSPCSAECSLLLRLTGRDLTVAVWDGDSRPPVPGLASSDAERGRGLFLVDALSEAWGVTRPASEAGKLVWARLPVPSGWFAVPSDCGACSGASPPSAGVATYPLCLGQAETGRPGTPGTPEGPGSTPGEGTHHAQLPTN
ncbi:ATP-binding protein [Actinacidiphila rubida]|uniref:Anti-sigma regulatory factor (Ser/Thr protein kinase) n=1 Tax=Actinacidiphila rubida TaxID=310780 RepID=A0A1H8MD36_9ACTN|nr:ATP-binding protein [Actinacidiphila rubida]SEO15271.1 Anti-sigma regulatory factor (Ser/Thr protein kinase) [Actinacidiphila rubida]